MSFTEAVILGAAVAAKGDPMERALSAIGREGRYSQPVKRWPWLAADVKAPCECVWRNRSGLMTVIHVWGVHVMSRRDWSLAEFYDWLASADPQVKEGDAVWDTLCSA